MAKGRITGRKGIQRFATHEEAGADREKWVAREVAEAFAKGKADAAIIQRILAAHSQRLE